MSASHTAPGRLLLVPAPLVDVEQAALTDVLPRATLEAAASLDHWIVENARTTRAVLGAVNREIPLRVALQQQILTVLPKHDELDARAARALLQPALAGIDMGLMSEAGAPCVADPGARIVAAAHELGIPVVPLVGPSSILLALMASGLDGQRFAFHGYLPVEPQGRAQRLRELERDSARHRQTQLFIETPYRNAALLKALLETLHPDTRVSIACELTSPLASIRTLSVAQWRTRQDALPRKAPAMFGFLAA